MKINFKNKQFRLVACGLWLVACGLWLVACKQESKKPIQIRPDNLPAYVSFIRTTLMQKIILNKDKDIITYESLRLYDFSFPNELGYKNSKKWSVFEDSERIIELGHKFHSMIKNNSDEGKYFISLANRLEGIGTSQPELLFVLPGIDEGFCKSLIKNNLGLTKYNAEIEIPFLSYSLNLSPHSGVVEEKDIVTITGKLPSVGCLKFQNKFYYYHVLYEL